MSESDYIDVLNKLFIYAVGLDIYANSLSECGMHISSIELPDLDKTTKTPSVVCKPSAFLNKSATSFDHVCLVSSSSRYWRDQPLR